MQSENVRKKSTLVLPTNCDDELKRSTVNKAQFIDLAKDGGERLRENYCTGSRTKKGKPTSGSHCKYNSKIPHYTTNPHYQL